MNWKTTRLATALMMAVTATTTLAADQTLTFAVGLPEHHGQLARIKDMNDILEERTGGALGVENHYSSLLNLAQTLGGVRDGIADIGFIVPPYHAAELPYTNLIDELNVLGTDPMVMFAATSEFTFTSPEILQESLDNGHVLIAHGSGGPYHLISREPMNTRASLEGKRIRSIIAFGRWAEEAGAIKVTMSVNDVYDALSRGAVDGVTIGASELFNQSFKDVTSYVTNYILGTFHGTSIGVNTDLWTGLTDEQRSVLFAAYAEASAFGVYNYFKQNRDAIEKLSADEGFTVLDPSADYIRFTEEFAAQDVANVVAGAKDKYGIEDAAVQVARFEEILAKWQGLMETMDRDDFDAFQALLEKEIWSQVDLSTLTDPGSL